ncbi:MULTISPECIES: type II toxin-antitoxin system VapC family toxin [unclassified Wenzhouxiangella]|uniref:type II toxin-antitoxin system VapC family toxin n=1 Tax=unclassified Wenzhouxiangella TaxID=2613841 RepID=UPI000E325121|nr:MULTISPECIES: type II toxin-antitoxin system VapC family toxin [unclassified Wenzhouxiangella]RFF26768.1 type II toxin-antitoxin system VapC family toxin [Wenzhouxiangella sp. 15181]RFP67732.1 type II toxin-antitoxin system VapC family toxin [Wenzhouxiangella sp. 15190]
MNHFLLDTHLLLWAAAGDARLPDSVFSRLEDETARPLYSAASIWEVVIKSGLGRKDFHVDAALLRRGLLDNGYQELPITGAHTLAVDRLPDHHRDPFDRILAAQSNAEGIELLTADQTLATYPGPITLVR